MSTIPPSLVAAAAPFVQTLNLVSLAEKGTLFENAYRNNRIGVPILHVLPPGKGHPFTDLAQLKIMRKIRPSLLYRNCQPG